MNLGFEFRCSLLSNRLARCRQFQRGQSLICYRSGLSFDEKAGIPAYHYGHRSRQGHTRFDRSWLSSTVTSHSYLPCNSTLLPKPPLRRFQHLLNSSFNACFHGAKDTVHVELSSSALKLSGLTSTNETSTALSRRFVEWRQAASISPR